MLLILVDSWGHFQTTIIMGTGSSQWTRRRKAEDYTKIWVVLYDELTFQGIPVHAPTESWVTERGDWNEKVKWQHPCCLPRAPVGHPIDWIIFNCKTWHNSDCYTKVAPQLLSGQFNYAPTFWKWWTPFQGSIQITTECMLNEDRNFFLSAAPGVVPANGVGGQYMSQSATVAITKYYRLGGF